MSRQVLIALVGLGSLVGCTVSDKFADPGPSGPVSIPGPAGGSSVGVGGAPVCGADGGVSPPIPPGPSSMLSAIFRPSFGATVKAAVSPPPLSGGTLAALSNDRVVVSDPERDHLFIVDLASAKVSADIALQPGDQPGRIVEGAAGIAHVVLRGGGAVISVDTAAGVIKSRRAVCAAPRGIAYDSSGAAVSGQTGPLLHVACAGGELVSLPAAGDAATPAVRTLALDRDLRDVVVSGTSLLVSRFRSAEVLVVDGGGQVTQRMQPGKRLRKGFSGVETMSAAVAWRMIPLNGSAAGGAAVVHQREQEGEVVAGPGGYSGERGCGSIVESAVTVITSGMMQGDAGPTMSSSVLPIDIAMSPTGQVAVLSAGNESSMQLAPVAVFDSVEDITRPGQDCVSPPKMNMPSFGGSVVGSLSDQPVPAGRTVALAYAKNGTLIGQSREPAQLWLFPGGLKPTTSVIALASDSRADTGHDIFHSNAGGSIACASCHPEGGDDGRVWRFACIGDRRTQSLRGGISGTEPFHWDGDQTTFPHLVDDVFVGRMGGPNLETTQTSALLHWIDTIPTLPALTKAPADSVARGKVLFESASVACGSCHTGARLTNNMTVDVGTGRALQVPSLTGVGWRAPFMHNGCASGLADRFGACGGGEKHGHTSQLTSDQRTDLVAYLESL